MSNTKTTTEKRDMLNRGDPELWNIVASEARTCKSFTETLALMNWAKRASLNGIRIKRKMKKMRLAIVGGPTLHPLHELIHFFLYLNGYDCDVFVGAQNSFIQEMIDTTSRLHRHKPECLLVVPGSEYSSSSEDLVADPDQYAAKARENAKYLIQLCLNFQNNCPSEVFLANFVLPSTCDLGEYRSRNAGSPWFFRKLVNQAIGLESPPSIRICDLEFLSARFGTQNTLNPKSWFEAKQPFTPDFLVELSKEVTHLVCRKHTVLKKVLITDLDNTLWGGNIGDDGIEGIELGSVTPRGEAFLSFQKYLLSLEKRGILLAVCSKNTESIAKEVITKHPEMALKLENFVAFKANWEPKPNNISQIASELNVGLDSCVFVDDNPAEIEAVNQFLPAVSTILIGPDPATFVNEVVDRRFFEPTDITKEDSKRTEMYSQETKRQTFSKSVTNLASYLTSLDMVATICEFSDVDTPRITQLINKSNQFNLTTQRRTQAEVTAIIRNPHLHGFTVRLEDRFGDNGLISVVILERKNDRLSIDTWLMSCRVLGRGVEEVVHNEIVKIAKVKGLPMLTGKYIATKKNGLVQDLFPKLGWKIEESNPGLFIYSLDLNTVESKKPFIKINRR